MTNARRGDRLLSSEEFELHVAQAVRLEHVGVLLGAGASVVCGGKAMAALWTDFVAQYGDLANTMVEQNFVPAPPETPNIEQALDKVAIALSDATRTGLETGELIAIRDALLRSVIGAAILDSYWLNDPSSAGADHRLDSHVRMLTRLAHTRQPGQPAPWVFTTNYDMAVELAAENASLHVRDGFRGFHDRVFTPSAFDLGLRNTEAQGEAQFGTYEVYLAKLHGSLSWTIGEDGGVRSEQIRNIAPRLEEFVAGNTDESAGVLVFPSSAKFVDTVGFVYGELMRRLTQFLSRPNVCLIVGGYGFGDNHLNRLLLSALNNPTMQLIVYLPEVDGFGDNGVATNHDALSASQRAFLNLKLPQVTVIGGGTAAYFDSLANHLPDPTVLDDPAERARRLAATLKSYLSEEITTGGAS